MIEMTQDEIEEKINLLKKQMMELQEKYLEVQNQMVNTQGFISIQLQTKVEILKNEYIKAKDEMDELKNILSYLEMDEEA